MHKNMKVVSKGSAVEAKSDSAVAFVNETGNLGYWEDDATSKLLLGKNGGDKADGPA